MNPLWIAIGASLLGGGLTGAVVGALVTTYRNRTQPIAFLEEFFPDYVPSEPTFDGESFTQLTFTNVGNTDYPEFNFGLTLDDVGLVLRTLTPDRHHQITTIPETAFNKPGKTVDFTLKPFNRSDTYTIQVLLRFHPEFGANNVWFSTAHPIVFVPMKSDYKLNLNWTAHIERMHGGRRTYRPHDKYLKT